MADERVIPGETHVWNVMKHISRYNFALQYCQGKRVLDVACGTGYGSNILSWVAKEVTAVEIDEAALKYARQNYDNSNIKWLQADLADMKFKQKFDVIVSFETIEHVADIDTLKKKYDKALKKKGILVYSVPLNEAIGFNEHHYHVFDRNTAKNIFPNYKLIADCIQVDLNIYPARVIPNQGNFTYFVGVFEKHQ